MTNIKRWSDEKLAKEIAFASASISEDHEETLEWNKKLSSERIRRVVGKKLTLNYPPEFVTLPEYTAHAGQQVTVVRELGADEYDYEGDLMVEVRADDGWVGTAYESELAE